MDKNHKLQRYSHKDYSELVDFPVEIVGRDGVIRRYTFEDSIRLYQRRITFAPIRYRDRDLIDAEVDHCRYRIDQLRRSFFYRYGWGTPDGAPDPEAVFGELAGEVAAFLRRVLRCEGRPDVRVEPVEEGSDGVSTWFLLPAGARTGMLLNVHRFEGGEREMGRERFFAALETLQRPLRQHDGPPDPDADGERLLAFHHTADCGLVLTGQGGQGDVLASLTRDDGVIRDIRPTRWDRLVDQVRLGQYQDAFGTARRLVREQPLHRRAYVVGAALASFLGAPQDAEELSVLGGLYFPDDADLAYWRGLSRWQQGRLREAGKDLHRALTMSPDDALARFLLVVVRFDQGRWLEASRVLRQRPASAARPERRDARRLDLLARAARLFALAGSAALGLVVVGLVLLPWLGALAVAPVALGALFGVLSMFALRQEVRRLLDLHRFDDVSAWVRRVGRASTVDAEPT